ncbi:unnamed protein product [Rotaria sp. Silwood1]|nr:unnamed protein product [Rotaria sp. Silwood1]
MKQTDQQPHDVRCLDKTSLVTWKKSYYIYVFDWNLYTNGQLECRIPIVEPSAKLDRPYCFDLHYMRV